MNVLLAVLLVFASYHTPVLVAQEPVVQGRNTLKVDLPNADWVEIFFEEIDERTKVAKFKQLRSTILPDDDLEVRVWIGFGLSPLEGFILRRTKGRWSGLYVPPFDPEAVCAIPTRSITPKSKWSQLWERLTSEGILVLPDSSELGNVIPAPDGESCVVEINFGGRYRAYEYGNPTDQKAPEAKRIAAIVETLFKEFGIER